VTTYVGVRELKAKLSEYLERAAAGETIVVTRRGKPKAELRAVSVDERIWQGIREGWE
jgi:prevent-host-death family protein